MATDYEPIRRIMLISAREPNPRRYTAMERIEKHFKVQPHVFDGINALGCRFVPNDDTPDDKGRSPGRPEILSQLSQKQTIPEQ